MSDTYKIGITGVTGFLGRELYQYFKERGYEVYGFSRKTKGGKWYIWNILERREELPEEIDVLIHCAGLVDDWAPYSECYKINVEGTKNVLMSALNVKKFIYISSFSVYDSHISHDQSIDENFPCGNFLNGYSRSKYEAEQVLLEYNKGPEKIIFRPHAIYGEKEEKILPRLMKAHQFGKFWILGDGENYISITHVLNLCEAIENAIMCSFPLDKEIFNISDAHPVRVKDLIEFIKERKGIYSKNVYLPVSFLKFFAKGSAFGARVIGSAKPPVITPYVVYQLTENHVLDISKCIRMLNYTPSWTYKHLRLIG